MVDHVLDSSVARLGLDVLEMDLPSLSSLEFVASSLTLPQLSNCGPVARHEVNVYMTSRSCEPLNSTKTSTTNHRTEHRWPAEP
jgi:hypothetical protein